MLGAAPESTPFFLTLIGPSLPQMHARVAFECLRQVPGLSPVMPQGAMYMMVRLSVPSANQN